MKTMKPPSEKDMEHYQNLIRWVSEDPERAFKLGSEVGCDDSGNFVCNE